VQPEFGSQYGKGFFFLATASKPTLRSTLSHIQRMPGILYSVVKRQGREPDPRLLLVPRLRMRGAIPLLRHMSSWRDA
jgi:hypothetical protein